MSNVPQRVSKFELGEYVRLTLAPSIQELLPNRDADWPGWMVAIRAAVLKDRKLMAALEANPTGMLLQAIKCATLGLSPNPALEHFAFVPFKDQIQGLVMWRGWQHLMMESGRVEYIRCDVIYRTELPADQILRDRQTDEVLHYPNDLERGDYKDEHIVGAYASAKLKDSPRFVSVFLSRTQIEKRRKMGSNGPAWRDHYPAMCMAKAMQALARTGRVPLQKRIAEIVAKELVEEAAPAKMLPATPPPRREITVSPPVATQLPPGAAVAAESRSPADQQLWEETDNDPLPSDEDLVERLRNAIVTQAVHDDVGDDELTMLMSEECGRHVDAVEGIKTIEEAKRILNRMTRTTESEVLEEDQP